MSAYSIGSIVSVVRAVAAWFDHSPNCEKIWAPFRTSGTSESDRSTGPHRDLDATVTSAIDAIAGLSRCYKQPRCIGLVRTNGSAVSFARPVGADLLLAQQMLLSLRAELETCPPPNRRDVLLPALSRISLLCDRLDHETFSWPTHPDGTEVGASIPNGRLYYMKRYLRLILQPLLREIDLSLQSFIVVAADADRAVIEFDHQVRVR